MITKLVAGAAAMIFTLTPAPSPTPTPTSSPSQTASDGPEATRKWDCANEFEQGDGDAGGSSGETKGYWPGTITPSVTARFRAKGEIFSLRNSFGGWANAWLYRVTPNGNIKLDEIITDSSSESHNLSLAEGLKVFVELDFNGNKCTSNIFTS